MFRFLKIACKLIIIAVIFSSLLFLYARHIEPFSIRGKAIDIASIHLHEKADGIKIAVFSDTHLGNHYTLKHFEKVAQKINAEHPDIVIFLGDFIDHYNEYIKTEDSDTIIQVLASIKAPYGKFAVFGNHDYGGGAHRHYIDIMNSGGFTLLINDSLIIDDLGVEVIGIDDLLFGKGDPLIAASASTDMFTLLLCHEPDIVDDVLDYDIDLMLSGHTHGRQINLMIQDDYFLPAYGKKYVKGFYSFDNDRKTKLYVNPGIGMTQLPLRFLSPPEITYLTLKRH